MDKKCYKILIVDDTRVDRALLEGVLKSVSSHYSIFSVSSGKEALELAEKQEPDIILLNVMMPDMSGYDLCVKFRENEKYKGMPIILITALDDVKNKVKGFESGATDYIIKPINSSEVNARVGAHLKVKHYQDELKDVTEKLRMAQSAIIESAKMSAVGSLAYGISHEFNNVLALISMNTQLFWDNNKLSQFKDTKESIDNLVSRGKSIVDGLLKFSSNEGYYEKQDSNIREIFDQILALMNKQIKDYQIEVKIDFNNSYKISCYPNQLKQALVNVIKNAIDAMHQNVKDKILTIDAKQVNKQKVAEIFKPQTKITNEKYVIFIINDTGVGIPEYLIERIYDPFITTKGIIGGGTDTTPGKGLGLSISYGIIKRHDGFMEVESEVDKGTRIYIALPS